MSAATLVASSDLGGPSNPGPARDGLEPVAFRCFTEQAAEPDYIFSARAGLGDPTKGKPSYLPRWKPGSVVTFAVSKKSFPTSSDLDFFERALSVAVDDWNSRDIGVTFKRAANNERAVFKIKYGSALKRPESEGLDYANAFFPNSEHRTLHVFDTALRARSHEFLSDILRHELGHVLGLRHEDAGTEEETYPSVELTPPNDFSIMIRQFSPGVKVRIQESDEAALKELYKLPESSTFREFKVVSVDPAVLGQASSQHSAEVYRGEAGSVSAGSEVAHGYNATNLTWFAFSVCLGFILARNCGVGVAR